MILGGMGLWGAWGRGRAVKASAESDDYCLSPRPPAYRSQPTWAGPPSCPTCHRNLPDRSIHLRLVREGHQDAGTTSGNLSTPGRPAVDTSRFRMGATSRPEAACCARQP